MVEKRGVFVKSLNRIIIILFAFIVCASFAHAVVNVSSCANLTLANTEYQLTDNVVATDTCFSIKAHNVTIDLGGFNVTGDDGKDEYGVYANIYKNATVKNGKIFDFYYGVFLWSNQGNHLENITTSSNNHSGVFISVSSNNTIKNITSNLNRLRGVILLFGSNNILTDITTNSNNDWGLWISFGLNNTFTNITSNSNNDSGVFSQYGSNNTLTNITANSNDGNGVYFQFSSNNTITNMVTNSNDNIGINFITGTDNNQLINITSNFNNKSGISISTNNNTLTNITSNLNKGNGIYIYRGLNNTFTNITSSLNNESGIYISTSSNNTFTNITSNSNNESGIYIFRGANNTIANMTTNLNNESGIFFEESTNNTISNFISVNNSQYGVLVNSSSDNIIQNSIIINNSIGGLYLGSGTNNTVIINSTADITVGLGTYFVREWSYQIYVNDMTGSPLSGANILIYNKTNVLVNNLTTNASGYAVINNLTEYINDGGNKTYHTNYAINVSKTGFSSTLSSLNLTANVNDVAALSEVADFSSCTNLSQVNTKFHLTANITDNSLTAPCINITAENITLDCQGYAIKSDDNVSGVYSEKYGTVVENCDIDMSLAEGGYGIRLVRANNSHIFDNTLHSLSRGITVVNIHNSLIENNLVYAYYGVAGIRIYNGSNNTIRNNVVRDGTYTAIRFDYSENNTAYNNTAYNNNYGITVSSRNSDNNAVYNNILYGHRYSALTVTLGFGYPVNNSVYNNTIFNNVGGLGIQAYGTIAFNNNITNNSVGITVTSSYNNTILNNTINSNNRAISLYGADDNGFINNSIWNCSWYGNRSCIRIVVSSGNLFDSNIINLTNSHGIEINSSIFGGSSLNNIFKNTNMTNIAHEGIIVAGNAGNNTFLNFTYMNITIQANTEIIRTWYYRAYVDDVRGNPIPNTSVVLYNSSNDLIYNLTTDSSGYTSLADLVEYVNDGENITYYENYTANFSKVGYPVGSFMFNITANINDFVTLEVPPTNISSCTNLSQVNTEFRLINNIVATETCFNVTSDNVTIDFSGYNITGDDGVSDYGVYVGDFRNVVIRNGSIYNMGIGIYLNNASYSSISNFTLNNNQNGINGFNGTNSLRIENTEVSSNNLTGIILNLFTNGSFINTTVNNNEYGISVNAQSSNNTITNSTISFNNYGIYIWNGVNNTIIDSNISSNVVTDVVTACCSNPTITLLNCSYPIEVSVANGELTRSWYYQVYVDNTTGFPISGANVLIYNSSNSLIENLTTNSSGYTNTINLIQYINNGGVKSYHTNYTVNTSNSGYLNSSVSFNLTESSLQTLTLTAIGNVTNDTALPSISFISPSPSSGSSLTSHNLTLNVTVTDDLDTYAFFSDGLIAWWTMDNATNESFYDESGLDNHLKVQGDVLQFPNGKFVSMSTFDGTGDYLDISNLTNSNETYFSAFTWVKSSIQSGTIGGVYEWGDYGQSWLMEVRNSGLAVRIGDDSLNVDAKNYNSTIDIANGNWHHVGFTYDGSTNTLKLYINGTEDAAVDRIVDNSTNQITNVAYNFSIGCIFNYGLPEAFFNGQIDEFIIFNRSLSSTEVQALYNSSQYNLERQLNLSNGSYSYTAMAVDSSGNQNSNTLSFTVNVSSNTTNITNDTIAPSVTLISPANGTSAPPTFYNFTFNVSDTSNISACNLIFDGALSANHTTVNKSIINVMNKSSIAVDMHNWSINCTDIYNNTGNSSLRFLTVTSTPAVVPNDTAPPSVTLISPANGTSARTTFYNFTFNVSDASNISTCNLIFDGALSANHTTVNKSIINVMNKSSIAVGLHNWSINCTDIYNNTGNSLLSLLTVTSTPVVTPNDNGGGGGGGGGGSGGGRIKTYYNLKEGPNILYPYKDLEITLNMTHGEEHRLNIIEINQELNNTIFTLKSEEQMLKAGINQTIKADVDEKLGYDLSFTLNKIVSNKRVKLTIEEVNEELPASGTREVLGKVDNNTIEEEINASPQVETPKVKEDESSKIIFKLPIKFSTRHIWMLAIIVVAIFMTAGVFVYRRNAFAQAPHFSIYVHENPLKKIIRKMGNSLHRARENFKLKSNVEEKWNQGKIDSLFSDIRREEASISRFSAKIKSKEPKPYRTDLDDVFDDF